MKEQIKEMVIKVIKEKKIQTGKKGYNPVWSGLNEFIRSKGLDPIEIYEELKKEGKIHIRPCRTKTGQGYVLLYLKEDIKEKDFSEFEKYLK
ncbi:MAG: hypothetical protein QXX03_05520 [Nitrososphaerota archaeon]